MSELDPPPPPATFASAPDMVAPTTAHTPPSAEPPPGTRPGDLTFAWRCGLAIAWMTAFFAYAAVWQASVQLGIATWWVGPRSSPTPTVVRAIPFLVTIFGILSVTYNRRQLARTTMVLAVVSLLIALPDFSRSVGLALVEVMISAAMLVVGAAALTGRYLVNVDATVPAAPVRPESVGSEFASNSAFAPPVAPTPGRSDD